jgi:hypothetical protein
MRTALLVRASLRARFARIWNFRPGRHVGLHRSVLEPHDLHAPEEVRLSLGERSMLSPLLAYARNAESGDPVSDRNLRSRWGELSYTAHRPPTTEGTRLYVTGSKRGRHSARPRREQLVEVRACRCALFW